MIILALLFSFPLENTLKWICIYSIMCRRGHLCRKNISLINLIHVKQILHLLRLENCCRPCCDFNTILMNCSALVDGFNHEHLHKILWDSILQILRYFSLDWLTDRPTSPSINTDLMTFLTMFTMRPKSAAKSQTLSCPLSTETNNRLCRRAGVSVS